MELTLQVLTWGIGAGFIATVIVLFLGIGAMAKGGDFNRRHGNRLMRLRVIFQGVTVVLVVIFLLVRMA